MDRLCERNRQEQQRKAALISHPDQPWAIRVSRADSGEALDLLMDAWYKGVTAGGGLGGGIGFDSHMEHRGLERAKKSIERAYGRSRPAHPLTLDALSAPIPNRKWGSPRL